MDTTYKVRIELEFTREEEARKVFEQAQCMKNCVHALIYKDEYITHLQFLKFEEAEIVAVEQEDVSPYLHGKAMIRPFTKGRLF
jgi:hypothetical protein